MSEKISLLHTEWSSGWGGQEIRILAESEAFRKRGFKVSIAAQPEGQLFSRAKAAGFEVFPVRMHKGLNISAICRLAGIIRNQQVDVVHTHSSVDHRLAALAARWAGRPVVRSRHLSTPIKRNFWSFFLYTRLADRIITSGKSIRDAMIEHNGMPPDLIVSVPAGIDVTQYSLARELPDVRAPLGLTPDDFVIGIVGVLRSWKGHADLLDAVRLASATIPRIKLIMVGDGPIKDTLAEQVKASGIADSVFMVGHQQDPAPYVKAMDIAVLASYANEATSQALPQAMAMRRAVISTNIGSLPEVVIHEHTGLLVPPRDPQSLAAAIIRLHQDPQLRQTLADNGYTHAHRFFTFESMIDRTQMAYQSVLES